MLKNAGNVIRENGSEAFKILRDEGPLALGDATLRKIYETKRYGRYGEGTDVMEEDWDNLLILDACRYDVFSDVNEIEGELESRISGGSGSLEFIQKNFCGRQLHDTVYITANPYVGHIDESVFHAVITLLDLWDTDLHTVKPEDVVEKVKEEYPKYNDKRIIVHFMQPHQPYIGEMGAVIRERMKSRVERRGWDNTIREGSPSKDGKLEGDVKELKAPLHPKIDVDRSDVLKAYQENLEAVLGSVEELLKHIDGRTVITADHGELIGEKLHPLGEPKYGHPIGRYSVELRKVPWLIIEGSRREIYAESPTRYEEVKNIDSKLEALGYKQ